jgi:hypothetical protein
MPMYWGRFSLNNLVFCANSHSTECSISFMYHLGPLMAKVPKDSVSPRAKKKKRILKSHAKKKKRILKCYDVQEFPSIFFCRNKYTEKEKHLFWFQV